MGALLRRLFSTFANGWPGAGLLLMRLVAGIALIQDVLMGLNGGPQLSLAILPVVTAGGGILLLAGLWTPVAGSVVAVVELWNAISRPGDFWTHILLGTLAAALTLVGPGAWSVDARLFGWKRIDIGIGRTSFHQILRGCLWIKRVSWSHRNSGPNASM